MEGAWLDLSRSQPVGGFQTYGPGLSFLINVRQLSDVL